MRVFHVIGTNAFFAAYCFLYAKLDLYERLGSYHYIHSGILNINSVKDTQRLYQNGLILLLVRKNQDFHIKINVFIL